MHAFTALSRLTRTTCRAAALGFAAFGLACVAQAETPQEFYKGKIVRLVNGGSGGSGYDLYSRMLAPWFEQKLGARVIVEARPGAGMLTAMNHTWTSAPDGLTMMLAPGEGAVLGQLAGGQGIRFKLAEFPILARVNTAPRLLIINPKLPYKTMADLVTSGRPFQFGSNGKTDGTSDTAVFVCHALNIPCKITIGYKSSVDFALAAVRGEVDGTILVEDSSERYAQGDQLRAIVSMSRERSKLFKDVPSIFEALPLTKEQQEWLDFRDDIRKIGRILIVPPGIDAAKLSFLRQVSKEILTDPQALEMFEKLRQPALYGTPEEIAAIINRHAFENLSPERQKLINHIIMDKFY